MRFPLWAVTLALLICFSVTTHAATITSVRGGGIKITGELGEGDEIAFQAKVATRTGAEPGVVYLDSPGGSIVTAVQIADAVQKAGMTTWVPYRGRCFSACVIVFAAGGARVANSESTIGVHSAGIPDQANVEGDLKENAGTLAMTALMGRVMAAYGAPPSVVGKMVSTPTAGMTVLTLADLEAWNVRISRESPGAEVSFPAPNPPSAGDRPGAYPPPEAQVPSLPLGSGSSDNVNRIIATFGAQSWQEKIAYLKSKGAAVQQSCGSSGCYYELVYSGSLATIWLYEADGRSGRPVRQSWCVSDPSALVRSCYDQGKGRAYLMRYDGAKWRLA